MRHPSANRVLGWCLLMSLVGTSCAVRSPAVTSLPAPRGTATSTIPATVTSSSDVAWLRTNAIPFRATEPSSDETDLEPLRAIVGDARIVALGEATHGTHEFFQMKDRMLRFLVTQMGFRIFAMEASWPEANRINDYVRTGQGDPAQLLRGLYFWTWDTQEVLDLIEWMRAYNEQVSEDQKISFAGFDMQFDQLARQNVTEYLQQVDPQDADVVLSNYSYNCGPTNIDTCLPHLQAVFDWITQHQVTYTASTSAQAFANALHSARIVVQYGDFSGHNNDFFLRDQYMAENVEWLLDQAGPNAKIVLWAHNGHVGTLAQDKLLSMGEHLRQRYGSQMVVFGLLFYQGSFHAYGASTLEVFQVDAPPADTVETFLHSAGLPLFFLDLRSVRSDSPAADWLLASHPFRMIGAAYDPYDMKLSFATAALAKVFDVVIYFQDSSPSSVLTK